MTAKKATKKNAGGRPPTRIDWSQVEAMAGIDCTGPEIAAVMKCSVDTMERQCKKAHGVTYGVFIAEHRKAGNVSLRREQWKRAMDGDRTMLVWLGKQRLGQSDRPDLDGEGFIDSGVYVVSIGKKAADDKANDEG